LHFRIYNFVRIHRTLRCTPAMAAGVTDRIWSVEELIDASQTDRGHASATAMGCADILLVAGITVAAWIILFALFVMVDRARNPEDMKALALVTTICASPAAMISAAFVRYRRARNSN
jgi:hypothetical protein